MENKDWKNRVANYEAEADASLWNNVSSNLPNGSNNWRYGILLILLLIGLGSGFYYYRSSQANTLPETEVQDTSKQLAVEKNSNDKIKPVQELNKTQQGQPTQNPVKKANIDQNNNQVPLSYSSHKAFENSNKPEQHTGSKAIYSTDWNNISGKLISPLNDSIYFRREVNRVSIPVVSEKPIVKDKKKYLNTYFSLQGFSSYHKINPNLFDDNVIEYVESEALSWDRLGFRTSAGFEKNLRERWKIYAGMSLVRQSQKITIGFYNAESNTINIDQSENELNLTSNTQIREETIRITNFSTGIQIGAKYKVLEREPLSQWVDLQLEGHYQFGDREFYGNQMYYLNMSYINYVRVSSKLQFRIAPVISYTFNNYDGSNDQLFNLKPYSLGIDIGFVFTF